MMKFKKLICTILSFVCMICFGLGISIQNTKVAKAESPTVTVAVNQNANNVEWDATQKRVLLDVVDKATGTAASITAWENITSSGVTMSGTGANLNFFGGTGDGLSVIYPSGIEDGAVFSIAEGTVIDGYVFPEFTLQLKNGSWTLPAKEPTVALTSVDTQYNNIVWSGTTMALALNFDTNFTAKAYDKNEGGYNASVISSVRAYTEINGQSNVIQVSLLLVDNSNKIGFLYDSSLLTVPEGQEYTTFTIEEGAPFGGEYLPAITLYLVDGKWTTEKPAAPDVPVEPDTPVEPSVPELGTPDVEFVGIHTKGNNSVWGGTTRALRLVFSENFDALAYDKNEGGYDAATIATVRNYAKINGQTLGNMTFLQIDNENSITFLYDESLLSVASGTRQTIFTIEEGAPFGGHYLPQITLYFNGETWQAEAIDIAAELLGVVDSQNNTAWDDTQSTVRLRFNYGFNNTTNYNINDADGLNMLSKLTFNGVALTESDILIFTEDIGGNTITMVYKNSLFDNAMEEGAKYHTLALTESVNYLGVDIPAFTLYLWKGVWITEMLPTVEMEDVETAVGYNTSSLIHIRDWNLDGDETTAVNNMILFFLPSGGFPEDHNLFLDVEKVAEYNVFDKIKLHMINPNSDADENGFVTLGQVFNAGGWYPANLSGGKDKIVVVNMWETVNSIAFSMGAAYTAESFNYIIIEEGCEFPNYYYTNKVDSVDYVQNGESVDYEDLEKVSFWQTQTVKIFTNPGDFQGPSINTNWGIDTNMGKIDVSGVDYADGYVIIQLENSNYPTEADGDNLNQNISAGNVPMSLNMLADIYVNGISLYDRVVHFGANGITSYYNYNGYGNFAISVVLENENEVVTEIIVAKDLRIPLYGMSDMAAAAYGTMYKETKATVSFSKGEQGFAQDEEIFWSVIFNDGENVKTVKVAHGEILAASDIPATPVKEGYEFVAWVYGIDGMYTFEPTTNIASCYYLTAKWTEVSQDIPPQDAPSSDSQSSSADQDELLADCNVSGCSGIVGSISAMASILTVAGIYILKKKED